MIAMKRPATAAGDRRLDRLAREAQESLVARLEATDHGLALDEWAELLQETYPITRRPGLVDDDDDPEQYGDLPPAPSGTTTLPATEARILEMQHRASRGYSIFDTAGDPDELIALGHPVKVRANGHADRDGLKVLNGSSGEKSPSEES